MVYSILKKNNFLGLNSNTTAKSGVVFATKDQNSSSFSSFQKSESNADEKQEGNSSAFLNVEAELSTGLGFSTDSVLNFLLKEREQDFESAYENTKEAYQKNLLRRPEVRAELEKFCAQPSLQKKKQVKKVQRAILNLEEQSSTLTDTQRLRLKELKLFYQELQYYILFGPRPSF